MEPGENEPVGLILCSEKDDAVVHYAMGHMPAKVFASRYLTDLPDPETLRREILATKHAFQTRAAVRGPQQEQTPLTSPNARPDDRPRRGDRRSGPTAREGGPPRPRR